MKKSLDDLTCLNKGPCTIKNKTEFAPAIPLPAIIRLIKKQFMPIRIVTISILTFLLPSFICAQIPAQLKKIPLINRVQAAPASVFTMFREADMNPVNHPLGKIEKEKVRKAIAMLPPLHQQILREHLQSISFMDSMPNNALTSLIGDEAKQLFNITFRAGILNETVSEWVTKKEYTSFNVAEGSSWRILVEAGNLDAIQYVFLHEATHVVDAVLHLTPPINDSGVATTTSAFTKDSWLSQRQPLVIFTDSLLNKARMRNHNVSIADAHNVYGALAKTPFTSLYSMAAWSEDIAELISIYHLTEKIKQPFKILIMKDNVVVGTYEPMENELVRKRVGQLKMFYKRKANEKR